MGLRQRDYCGLVEPVSEQPVAAARTIAMVRDGKIPVRLCNIHPYSVFVGKYQKLGRLYEVNSPDIYGCRDLGLTLDTEGIVEVSLIEASPLAEDVTSPGICQLSQRSDLITQQCHDLNALLKKWSTVFAESEDDVGYTEVVQHRIHTGNVPPIRERFRPLPPMMYQEMKALLTDMLDKGVISESASPWAAPVVMVKKKDGSWRFCVDYRKLNAVTHKDAFPLPRIEETLTTLKRAEWFSTLDLASGYWQVAVDPEDRPKTAFATPLGLYEFQRMPFGLCNGPATFQRLMQRCLSGYIIDFSLVYLDDIIVYSFDFSTHLSHLEQIFQRLSHYGLKLRPDKCRLFQQQVKFLSHVVDKVGVHPDPEKTAAVQGWPTPTTVREVRAFLGLAGYYRHFIANFSKIAQPLNALLVGIPVDTKSGTRQIEWTAACQAAFETLKSCLTKAPVLAYADFTLPFVLYTDASHQGSVLSQAFCPVTSTRWKGACNCLC